MFKTRERRCKFCLLHLDKGNLNNLKASQIGVGLGHNLKDRDNGVMGGIQDGVGSYRW